MRNFEELISLSNRMKVYIFQLFKSNLQVCYLNIKVRVVSLRGWLSWPQLLNDSILFLSIATQLVNLALQLNYKLLIFVISAVTGIFLELTELPSQLLNSVISFPDFPIFVLDQLIESFEFRR